MRKKIKKRESLKLFVRREWDIALDPNRLDTTNADESKKVGLRLRRLSRIAGKSTSCLGLQELIVALPPPHPPHQTTTPPP